MEHIARHVRAWACLGSLVLVVLAGCRDSSAEEGRPADWLSEARALEAQGRYFREKRAGAPRGALEYYERCLKAKRTVSPDPLGEFPLDDLRRKVDWLRALRLVMREEDASKADYRGAIRALTEFRRRWPESPRHAEALFFRALAREYDMDYQDIDGAVADYRLLLQEAPESPLVPEVMLRIGHCHEFNLDAPDYEAALEAYDKLIERFGPSNETLRKAPTLTRMAVERALYYKARILEDRMAPGAEGSGARRGYAAAAACYRRLTDPMFFSDMRFKQSQFVHFRLGCILAERLGRVDEGLEVLEAMARRWRESPWYGRVKAKIEAIREGAEADVSRQPASPREPKVRREATRSTPHPFDVVEGVIETNGRGEAGGK